MTIVLHNTRSLLLVAILAISGCESTSIQTPRQDATDSEASPRVIEGLTPREIEARIAQTPRTDTAELRIAALRGYLLGDDLSASERLLNQLNASRLSAQQKRRVELLTAEYLALQASFDAAMHIIDEAADSETSSPDRVRVTFSHAHILVLMQRAPEAIELLMRSASAAPEQAWLDLFWKALVAIPPWHTTGSEDLWSETLFSSELRAWRELRTTLLSATSLGQQRHQLRLGPDGESGILERKHLPSMLALIRESANQPIRVGLILPLSASLGAFGQAFLEGFTAAWFTAVPDSQVTFTVYDADELDSAGDYNRLSAQLVADRVQVVVGPVSRDRLDALQPVLPAEMGWIALNRLQDAASLSAGQFVFQLSTEDEVRALAEHIRAEGAIRVLAYYSDSGWARRALETLQQTLGVNSLKGAVHLSSVAAITEEVGLSLLTDSSEARIREIHRLLRGEVETVTRRRQDVDAVVAFVDGSLAAALRPALRYHDAGDIPVYGTSRLVRALHTEDYDVFAGTRFLDLPWNVADSGSREMLHQAFGQAPQTLETFRAVGMDCFRLVDRFHLLRTAQQRTLIDALDGATGLLRIGGHQIRRELLWSEVGPKGIAPISPAALVRDE